MSKDTTWPKPRRSAQHAPTMPGNTPGQYVIPFRYPNYGYYDLRPAKTADDRYEILADGPTKILFRRVRKKSRKYRQASSAGSWDGDRLRWIARMTGGDAAVMGKELRRHEHWLYESDEAYVAAVNERLAQARAAHQKLIEAVRKSGFLGKRTVEPSFDVEVYDIRGPETMPLPGVAGVQVLRKHQVTSKPTSRPDSRPTSKPTSRPSPGGK